MAWLKEWDQCVFKRIPPKKRKVDEENQFVSKRNDESADKRSTLLDVHENE